MTDPYKCSEDASIEFAKQPLQITLSFHLEVSLLSSSCSSEAIVLQFVLQQENFVRSLDSFY